MRKLAGAVLLGLFLSFACCWASFAGDAAFEELSGFREAWPPPSEKIEVFRPEEGKCRFPACVWNPEELETEILDAPGGEVMAVLPFAPDDPRLIMVTVTGFRGDWLRVEIYDDREGWLPGGLAEASLRNYGPGDSAELRAGPGREHPALGDIYGERIVKILGGEGEWALIRYIEEGKDEVIGWTKKVNLCWHPYTTCP
ncbi:MAG: SH3 domain-containing protein [Aminivibrio sp.]